MGAARYKDVVAWNGENRMGIWTPIMSPNIKMQYALQIIPITRLSIVMLERHRSSISECDRLCAMKGRDGGMGVNLSCKLPERLQVCTHR